MVRLQLRAPVFSQGYQIRARIKIRDFEVQEFTSLAASPGSGPEPNAKRAWPDNISQRVLIKIAADHEVQVADPLPSPSPPCSLDVLVFPIHSLVAQRGLEFFAQVIIM